MVGGNQGAQGNFAAGPGPKAVESFKKDGFNLMGDSLK